MLVGCVRAPLAALNTRHCPGSANPLSELAIFYLHVLIMLADLLSCGSRKRRMRGGSLGLINTQGFNYEFLQHWASNEEQALKQPLVLLPPGWPG